MKKKTKLTLDRLKEVFHYDPLTGVFTRIRKTGKSGRLGPIPDGLDKDGYKRMTIDGEKHRQNRVAWFYVYGLWPENVIDHKDRIKTNNAIDNLRDVTVSVNGQNKSEPSRKNSKSGMLGVCWNAIHGKWFSTIMLDGKATFLGYFSTPEAAQTVYLKAKREIHEGCTI